MEIVIQPRSDPFLFRSCTLGRQPFLSPPLLRSFLTLHQVSMPGVLMNQTTQGGSASSTTSQTYMAWIDQQQCLIETYREIRASLSQMEAEIEAARSRVTDWSTAHANSAAASVLSAGGSTSSGAGRQSGLAGISSATSSASASSFTSRGAGWRPVSAASRRTATAICNGNGLSASRLRPSRNQIIAPGISLTSRRALRAFDSSVLAASARNRDDFGGGTGTGGTRSGLGDHIPTTRWSTRLSFVPSVRTSLTSLSSSSNSPSSSASSSLSASSQSTALTSSTANSTSTVSSASRASSPTASSSSTVSSAYNQGRLTGVSKTN
ncbi:unnamed protein product [Protopolystoma xenopodis]|uniref:Uncharacterized protein n=1 Tax=Protopolystoma xenopodis TaxID=117903 RepID=A0A3S5FEJ4_9PLAT|nr:unnamed protein product [Protopolystoma xenopodis]